MAGRQAEAARNDRALLDAAREVFSSQGFDAPVSAIAERAGVGIGSLYRRYGSKDELLQRLCVLAMEQAIEAATAALREPDVWNGLTGYVRECVAFGSGALAPVAGTIEVTPQMLATARRSRRLAETLVRRAKRAGVLRADVATLDVLYLIEQFSRRSRTRPADGDAADEDGNARARVLTIALDGLRAHGDQRLPGRAPSWRRYESRWARDS
jgi:AcrR family transcriptional regulator